MNSLWYLNSSHGTGAVVHRICYVAVRASHSPRVVVAVGGLLSMMAVGRILVRAQSQNLNRLGMTSIRDVASEVG